MSNPAPRGRAATGVLLGAVVGGLAGCTRPVAVSPPVELSPSAAQACADLATLLPDKLNPVGDRREVTPQSLLTAAWGDPPAVLRCGVPRPTAMSPTSQLITVNGVDWFPEELTAGYLMTTVGRTANVEITVPSDQGPAPSIAADLAAAIKNADPIAPSRDT